MVKNRVPDIPSLECATLPFPTFGVECNSDCGSIRTRVHMNKNLKVGISPVGDFDEFFLLLVLFVTIRNNLPEYHPWFLVSEGTGVSETPT